MSELYSPATPCSKKHDVIKHKTSDVKCDVIVSCSHSTERQELDKQKDESSVQQLSAQSSNLHDLRDFIH